MHLPLVLLCFFFGGAGGHVLSYEVEGFSQFRRHVSLGKWSGVKSAFKGRGWMKGADARTEIDGRVFLLVDGVTFTRMKGTWFSSGRKRESHPLSENSLGSFLPLVTIDRKWRKLPDEVVNHEKCKVYERNGETVTTKLWKREKDGVVIRVVSESSVPTGKAFEINFKNWKLSSGAPQTLFSPPSNYKAPK